ncbi:MAG TPA: efflux RND transporter periplasmic adaptor subunit [Myxococcaceae bacterium]
MSPDAGSGVLAGFRRANRAPLLVGGGIALVTLVLLSWTLLRGRETTSETVRHITVRGNTLTIPEQAPQWRYVELSTATEAPPLPPPPVPGRVSFDEKRTASLSAPLPGRVERVLVRIGDRVQEGERLFNVRSAAWADLEREMASARANVEVKRRIAARARELVEIRAAPEKDALAAEADLHEAELAARASAAKRSSLRIAPEGDNLFWVVAPRSGSIVDLDVVASQEVQPSGDHPLVRISELSEVLVLADVQESDAYDLRVGGQVTIRTRAGSVTRTGTIERISEVVDPKRRTVELRIRATNDDRALRPNAFVDVELQSDPSQKRIRVPAEAVVTDGQSSVVFVSRGEGQLERVTVTPGRQRSGEVELRSGLEPGSRYVSKGAILLLNQLALEH